MQQFDVYLRAQSVKATLVDQFNNANSTKCSLTRGMQAELVLHLFHAEDMESVFTLEELQFVSWAFCADSDYDVQTTPKLRVVEGIFVDENALIHIPILNANTQELIDYLGSNESKDLKCELVAMPAGDVLPAFCLQWEISIRNRIGDEGTGQPEPLDDQHYTRSQVDAIIAASNTVQYSVDGIDWFDECPPGATQRRYKNSCVSGADWTIESLVQGPAGSDGEDGKDGKTICLYVGYAADADGTDFSTTPANSRKYRAEFHDSNLISEPTLADFVGAGATWVKYLGDDGLDGSGDMSTGDYVSAGGTGVVVSARRAGAVAWSGIDGKPSAFAPTAHNHSAAEISDGARQTVFRGATPQILPINRHIVQQTNIVGNGVLNIDFNSIVVSSGGAAYVGSAGDVFTWEYWVFANADIVSVNLGSSLTISALEDEPLPEELPTKGGDSTLHAFAVRAFYKSGAAQNMKVTVNYLYSTEA